MSKEYFEFENLNVFLTKEKKFACFKSQIPIIDQRPIVEAGPESESETKTQRERERERKRKIKMKTETEIQEININKETICNNNNNKKNQGNQPAIEKIKLLNNVSGKFRSKKLVAIMGSSGAGKTTLLDMLANRFVETPKYLTQWPVLRDIWPYFNTTIERNGRIIWDGGQVTTDFFTNHCAYVPQDSIMLACQTVRESLAFAAELKHPHASKEELKLKVDNIISEFGLIGCADTQIGDELVRGISGGQARRTSIAVELLHAPKIVFLDEPTTGLDSETALTVMNTVSQLAKGPRGALVIASIHQPSQRIFELFDELVIMRNGRIYYQGSAKNAPHRLQENASLLKAYLLQTLKANREYHYSHSIKDRAKRNKNKIKEMKEIKKEQIILTEAEEKAIQQMLGQLETIQFTERDNPADFCLSEGDKLAGIEEKLLDMGHNPLAFIKKNTINRKNERQLIATPKRGSSR